MSNLYSQSLRRKKEKVAQKIPREIKRMLNEAFDESSKKDILRQHKKGLHWRDIKTQNYRGYASWNDIYGKNDEGL